MDVSYFGAAGAGMLSFLSPCVLPLVPAYLCFLGGVSVEQLAGAGDAPAPGRALARRVLPAALAFVLGFSTVFVALGASASWISGFLLDNKLWLSQVAGAVIVLFGLQFMGVFRLAFLNYEARFAMPRGGGGGLAAAYLMGLAFAFGWTPCIGPVLATILTVAARQESIGYGTTLLSVYAAGLGIPFLLAALLARPFLRWLHGFRRHLRLIELLVGGLLVLTGTMFLLGSFETVGFWLIETFPALGEIG